MHDSVILAGNVVETLVPLFNASSGIVRGLDSIQTALLLNSISLLDHKAGSATYHDVVIQNINAAVAELGVSQEQPFVAYPIEWGLAAVRAYRAYNDTTMLTTARGVWEGLFPYFVTAEHATQGIHPTKNTSIQGECGGTTTAGAIFRDSQALQDVGVNTETVGAFSALSGLLFEATQGPQYHEAAELSASFIKNHLWDEQIIRDSFDLHSCSAPNEIQLCYNTGKMFEATSILASVDQTWNVFLTALVASATAFTNWTGSDGVNTEAPDSINDTGLTVSRKVFFMRGLYETWERTSNIAMANYIQVYLSVQFNALRVIANTPGTDRYSPNWGLRPPPGSLLLPEGQLTALDVLSSQVGFARLREATAQNTSSTDSPAPTTSTAAMDFPKTSHTRSIIGATIGGAGFILLISAALWYFLRRHRTRDLLLSPGEKSPLPSQRRLPESPHPSVVPFDVLERPAARGLVAGKRGGCLAEFGSQNSNDAFRDSSFPPLDAPFVGNSAGGIIDSQGSTFGERRSYDSGMRERIAVGMSGPTSPDLVELLRVIATRYPSEDERQAPPSYYTD